VSLGQIPPVQNDLTPEPPGSDAVPQLINVRVLAAAAKQQPLATAALSSFRLARDEVGPTSSAIQKATGGATRERAKLLRFGGYAAGVILIIFGIATIAIGIAGKNTVEDELTQE
jgi:hypothetical protein